MGIPDHLICLLRNLYAGQEATVRTGHGTTYWFQIGKGEHQGCILSPCLFNLYAEYIMRNAGLEETVPFCGKPQFAENGEVGDGDFAVVVDVHRADVERLGAAPF